jgi:hypothetical protein
MDVTAFEAVRRIEALTGARGKVELYLAWGRILVSA